MFLETTPENATLLDVLIDGFEKNESVRGFYWRDLPFGNEAAARGGFERFTAEGRRWKGEPARYEDAGPRRIAAWPDLEIRQVDRGITVLARVPGFGWWNDGETWEGNPLGAVHAWMFEDSRPERT